VSPTVVALALSAAVLHAAWNAFLRNGGDRLMTVALMSVSGTLAALPFVCVLALPHQPAWGYIVVSAALQVGYSLFLVGAYRHGDLGQVYPIVRGTVPILIMLGGVLFSADRPTAPQVTGVALVAAGLMSFAIGKHRASLQSIRLALATGTLIACYATVDSIGVRLAGDSRAYAAWVVLLYGLLLPAAVWTIRRGKIVVDLRLATTWKALAGGLVATLAYGAVVAAFALGPAGPISALRETSVVFAVLIGRVFLGESLTIARLAACLVIAAGAICLA